MNIPNAAGEVIAIANRCIERLGVLEHAAEYRRRTDIALATGKISAEVATALNAQVDAFAGEVATGLHLGGEQPAGMRREMRDVIARAGLSGGRR